MNRVIFQEAVRIILFVTSIQVFWHGYCLNVFWDVALEEILNKGAIFENFEYQKKNPTTKKNTNYS